MSVVQPNAQTNKKLDNWIANIKKLIDWSAIGKSSR